MLYTNSTVAIFSGLSGLVLGFVLGFFAHPRIMWRLYPPKPAFGYQERADRLERFPPIGAIAFVGDSMVERADWSAMISPEIANYGISGETSAQLLGRINRIKGNKFLLLTGINDIRAKVPTATIAENIMAAAQKLPGPVTVFGVLPAGEEFADQNATILALNALLKASCAGKCTYVDTWPAMAVGGRLPVAFTNDSLHLTGAGYQALSDLVRAHL